MELIYEDGVKPTQYTLDTLQAIRKALGNPEQGNHEDMLVRVASGAPVNKRLLSFEDLGTYNNKTFEKNLPMIELRYGKRTRVSNNGKRKPNKSKNPAGLAQLLFLYSKHTYRFLGVIGNISIRNNSERITEIWDQSVKAHIEAGFEKEWIKYTKERVEFAKEMDFKNRLYQDFYGQIYGFNDPRKDRDIIFITSSFISRRTKSSLVIDSYDWSVLERSLKNTYSVTVKKNDGNKLDSASKSLIKTFVRELSLPDSAMTKSVTVQGTKGVITFGSECNGVPLPSAEQASHGWGLINKEYEKFDLKSTTQINGAGVVLRNAIKQIFKEAADSLQILKEGIDSWVGVHKADSFTYAEKIFLDEQAKATKALLFTDKLVEEYVADNIEDTNILLEKLNMANYASGLIHSLTYILRYIQSKDIWYISFLDGIGNLTHSFVHGWDNLPEHLTAKVRTLDMAVERKGSSSPRSPIIPCVGYVEYPDQPEPLGGTRWGDYQYATKKGMLDARRYYYIDNRELEQAKKIDIQAVSASSNAVNKLLEKFGVKNEG